MATSPRMYWGLWNGEDQQWNGKDQPWLHTPCCIGVNPSPTEHMNFEIGHNLVCLLPFLGYPTWQLQST